VFAGNVLSDAAWLASLLTVTEAVVIFTIVASSVYFFNDLMDIKADSAHPFKRKRPIAAGKVSKALGWTMFGLLTMVGLGWAGIISSLFFWVVLGYWVMQLLYSRWLKNIEVVDVFIIAIGFFLRVFAGAIVVDLHLSIWFFLCVISVSLFLAVGKRRAELAILSEQTTAIQHRKVMGKYTPNILDAYLIMFATASFLSWALYTFNFYQQSGPTTPRFGWLIASRTLTVSKWLMATIPVVIFGIMRYIRIIYDGARAETPERVFLSDKPLLVTVAVWAMMVMVILYL
jgi:4-hydroxybenzoate polyprenyltransferase